MIAEMVWLLQGKQTHKQTDRQTEWHTQPTNIIDEIRRIPAINKQTRTCKAVQPDRYDENHANDVTVTLTCEYGCSVIPVSWTVSELLSFFVHKKKHQKFNMGDFVAVETVTNQRIVAIL